MGQGPSGVVGGAWEAWVTLRGEGPPPPVGAERCWWCSTTADGEVGVWLWDMRLAEAAAAEAQRPDAVRLVNEGLGGAGDLVRLQGQPGHAVGPFHAALFLSLGPGPLAGTVLLRGLRFLPQQGGAVIAPAERHKVHLPLPVVAELGRLLPFEGEHSTFPLAALPLPVLVQVFQLLPPHERRRAALVCRAFHRALPPPPPQPQPLPDDGFLPTRWSRGGLAQFFRVDVVLPRSLPLTTRMMKKAGMLQEDRPHDNYTVRVATQRSYGDLIVEFEFKGVWASFVGGKGMYWARLSLGRLALMQHEGEEWAAVSWGSSKFRGTRMFRVGRALEYVKAELEGKYEVP
jgi:hypothetical protein